MNNTRNNNPQDNKPCADMPAKRPGDSGLQGSPGRVSDCRRQKSAAALARKTAYLGMLTALSMIFSYVEALIPFNFGIPGIKLGLANLMAAAGLWILAPAQVFAVSMLRILLTGFLFGSGVSIIYSLAGGVVSFAVMLLLKRFGSFSVFGASVAGGVSHNAAQLSAAILIMGTWKLVWYLPVLTVAGSLTGALIGIAAARVLPVISRKSLLE